MATLGQHPFELDAKVSNKPNVTAGSKRPEQPVQDPALGGPPKRVVC